MGKTAGKAAPFALPLREVGWWTTSHRARIEAKHEKRRAEWEAQSLAAFDALHRTAPDPLLVATETGGDWHAGTRAVLSSDPPSVSVGRLAPLLAHGRSEPSPPYDPVPTVTRRRVRWSLSGSCWWARRSRETRKIEIEAHKAHASSAAWHAARAEGQRHRMAHVGACGVGMVSVQCTACGVVHEAPAWCAVVRLCPGCNKRRAARMQARFGVALGVVVKDAERAGTLRKHRRGGALRQKHMTLTAPHVEARPEDVERVLPLAPAWGAWHWVATEHPERFGVWGWAAREHASAFECRTELETEKATVRRRIQVMTGAQRAFTRRLQAFLREPWPGKKKDPTVGACWHRCFEWTPGEDGLGHPHFHLWMLLPWVPVADEHDIAGIAPGGARRRTSPCKAPRRLRGAWGWAETMRRERCEMCVPGPTRPAGVAWGWAAEWHRARHLDTYYRQARAPWMKAPAVPRRTGIRSWWADALAAEGAPVDDALVSVYLGEARAVPVVQVTEIHKPNGIVFRQERQKKVEIRDASGRLLKYFEAWCIAFEDAPPHVLAAVYEGLEGRRLSQSSKVTLRNKKGEDVKLGLLGIADGMFDASCRDCTDASSDKVIEVVTWKRVVGARVGPPLPPATAPPEYRPASGESYEAALVERLRAEERLESGAELTRLLDMCETIRAEGPSVLPVYRRTGLRQGGAPRRDLRSLMKRRAKS